MCEVKMLNTKDISTIIIWLTPRNSLLHRALFDSSLLPHFLITYYNDNGGGGGSPLLLNSCSTSYPTASHLICLNVIAPVRSDENYFLCCLPDQTKNDSNSAISSPNVVPSKINPDKQAEIIVIIFMIIFTFLLLYCLSPHTRKQAPCGRRTLLSCSLVYPQSLA